MENWKVYEFDSLCNIDCKSSCVRYSFRNCRCCNSSYIFLFHFHIFPLFHAYEIFSSLYLTAPDITQAVVSTHSHSHEMILHSSNSVLNGLGIGVLLASVGMKEWLYQQTMKIAKKTDSSVLKANAWHHRVDALSAVVALVGLSGRVDTFFFIFLIIVYWFTLA